MGSMNESQALSLIRRSAHFRDLEKNSGIKKTSISPLSADDLGYLSIVYQTVVHFEDGSEFSFVIKVPSLKRFSEGLEVANKDNFAEVLFSCHNRECHLYDLLDNVDVPVPKLYAFEKITDYEEDSGYIAMESFIGKAVILGAISQVTAKQVTNLASHLGKFRAEIEKLPKDKWSHLNDPFRMDIDFVSSMMKPNIIFLVDYDRATFQPLVEKYKPFSCQTFYRYLLQSRAVELGVESLVHSDLHGGNLMFKTNPDGSISDELATLIDWQAGFNGNPLFDLARFACISADVDIRRGVEDEAVEAYYTNYLRNTKTPNPKFTREVCRELYDLGVLMEAIEWQLLFGVFMNKPNGQTDSYNEALKARVALRVKLCMEDGLRIIEKYELQKVLEKVLKQK